MGIISGEALPLMICYHPKELPWTRIHLSLKSSTNTLFCYPLFYFFDQTFFYLIVFNLFQAYARIGMTKEAADAASQANDGELLGRLRLSFSQNGAASSIFDTLRSSFQGVS